MRGFFHDVQSADIEGSILHELGAKFNVGLCKWAQYVNALSDATGCDPGSIIAMAGELSFKACGADPWGNASENGQHFVHIGRGYECKDNYSPLLFERDEAGQMQRK